MFSVVIFVIGFIAITVEHRIKINKAAIALLMGTLCWGVNFIGYFPDEIALHHLIEHLGEISQVVIFLIGSMTIVELIDTHHGFRVITNFMQVRSSRKLFGLITIITFFLSAVINNLTVAILMIAVIRKLIDSREERLVFSGMIIIAANAGGVWTPMGDVTTTMLWIGNRVTTGKMIQLLLLPSLISVVVPFLWLLKSIPNDRTSSLESNVDTRIPGSKRVLVFGIASLLSVPILKAFLGMPPYMGMMLGLGVMWVLTDLLNKKRPDLNVTHVLTKIDISSILFFLGILLAVAAMETSGILEDLSIWMATYLKNTEIIVIFMGIMSSIIDNVPLTAAAMGMYDLSVYAIDSKFWEMMVYSVGTGGSLLIIGSAAGVIVMGMEKISFVWYLKKISFPVLIGYFLGILSFLMIYSFI